MADIKDLFNGRDKKMQNMNVGGMQVKIDVNSLPDMPCIHCGEKEFIQITRLKKLSRTLSPNGQEGTVNVNMLVCKGCNWIFNAKEWEDHNKEQDDTINANETLQVKDTLKVEDKADDKEYENKILCRLCGIYFDKGTDHDCKPINAA